jgi:hypothetical protein
MQRLWALWKGFAGRLADVQARLILTLFYFVILGPVAVALRLRSDPLAIKPGSPRGWRARNAEEPMSLERAAGQY